MKRDEWTDRLSDYLDDELTDAERQAMDAHLAECADCAAALEDLRRVVSRAQSLPPRPPQRDLWIGIAPRIAARPRFSFTLPQLAAASVLIAAASGLLAWQAAGRHDAASRSADTTIAATTPQPAADTSGVVQPVSLADAQYDAAVTDLERALAKGRGRLDKTTIAIVEENLNIIDQAIGQARTALASDPANAYLSSHLVEARRKKLDLLRRAAALTETN